MHLVYIVEFVDRLASDTKPYYYIGSKANSTFVDGEIRDKKNAAYRGSSTKDDYQNLVASEKIKVSILGEFDDYEACLDYENQMHKHHNVVADPRYFNRAEAKVCNFHAPGYGTFRHSETGKIVKLPTDHAQVNSGEFVNVNCVIKLSTTGWWKNKLLKPQRFQKDGASVAWRKISNEVLKTLITARHHHQMWFLGQSNQGKKLMLMTQKDTSR